MDCATHSRNGNGTEIAMIDLSHVRYLVDDDGHPTAAVVEIEQWQALLELLEDDADVQLAMQRMATWSSKKGWTPWADIEADWRAT